MRLLPQVVDQPEFAPLQQFLANDRDLRKRYQLAERLADLFDQYQVYRSDWLEDWAVGNNQLRQLDGQPQVTPEKAQAREPTIAWQAALWRVLIADIGEAAIDSSRAAVHPRFIKAMHDMEQPPANLPQRIIVFGISSLPAQMVEALAALSRFTQWCFVCITLVNFTGLIVEDKQLLRHEYVDKVVSRVFRGAVLERYTSMHTILAAWASRAVIISTCWINTTNQKTIENALRVKGNVLMYLKMATLQRFCSSCTTTFYTCDPCTKVKSFGLQLIQPLTTHCAFIWPTVRSVKWRFCTISYWLALMQIPA